jgi:polysaccharide export outer membrane protein
MRILIALLFIIGLATGASAQALQPGDTISVSVWQEPKLDRTVVIPPGGMISFPLAGPIRASGLTPEALADVLRGRLQKNYTEKLDITVAFVARVEKDEDEDLAPRVYVTGEVARPGPYIVKLRTNVVQAIALAGGLSPFAAKQRIQVRRKIKGVDDLYVFNYVAYESGQDMGGNIDLKSGDIVIVPERGLLE